MADRFPSLEDIDAGQTELHHDNTAEGGDFLSRERALLGEDADLFSTGNESKNVTLEDGDDDLLGGDFSGGAPQALGDADELNDFESSFPAVDTSNTNVGPGGTITNSALPFQPTANITSGGGYTNYNPQSQDEETEPIRAWREKRNGELARRDEASQHKKDETIATAQKDIDSFYESYNRKVDKQKAQTAKEAEEFLAKREDTSAGGTSWERIAKLVDLSGKGQTGGGEGSSKKRMREMLLSLKADKEAPGAAGI